MNEFHALDVTNSGHPAHEAHSPEVVRGAELAHDLVKPAAEAPLGARFRNPAREHGRIWLVGVQPDLAETSPNQRSRALLCSARFGKMSLSLSHSSSEISAKFCQSPENKSLNVRKKNANV